MKETLIEKAVLENLRILPPDQKQAVLKFVQNLVETNKLEQLKKAKNEEYEWLKAAMRNPVFDWLKDPEEDIYTLADGKPFHDPEYDKSVINDPDLSSITDPEEDI
jgi:hypothetical protein